MRHLLLAGVVVLASTATSAAQTPAPLTAEPITVSFFEAPLDDAISLIARVAGITIELDATVTEEMRRVPVANHRLRLVNATVEQALGALTSIHGLTYTITGPRAVRISKKV